MFPEYYQYFQYLSLLVAIIFAKELRQNRLELFVPLLIVVCITETTANYLSNILNREDNYKVYNLYLIISTPLILCLFFKMLDMGKTLVARVFLYVAIFFEIFLIINYVLLQGLDTFNSYSLILIMSLNIFFSCMVLLNLARNEEREIALLKEPYFWINSANLLFSLSTLVILGLYQYIHKHNIELGNKSLYRYIVPASNVILYSAYTYSFYLCRTQAKTTK